MADASADKFYDAAEPPEPPSPSAPRRPRPRPRLAHTRSAPSRAPRAAGGPPAERAVSAAPSPRAADGASSPSQHGGAAARWDGGWEQFVPGVPALVIPRRYEVAHDIFYAERAPDAELSIVKIAREAIGGLKQGADITNVNLPASVLDPVSSLEKGMKSMQRGELVPLIVREEDARKRFLRVLAFYFSGLSKEKFGKKPYNPILGEVFRAGFLHREGAGQTVLVAEQVSHHPPVTALHLWNEVLGFRMNSHALPEPRFWGNSVEVKLKGSIRIGLDRWGEEYEATRPYMHMSGFLAGRHRLEFVGPSEVRCAKSGYAAELEFKAKGLLGRGELNAVAGRVFEAATGATIWTLAGTWDGVITATEARTGGESVMFDYERAVADYSMCAVLPPEREREPTYSSVVWAECSRWIWKADTPAANAAKRRVEDAQRAQRQARVAAGAPWLPTYFEPRRDGRDGFQLREALRSQVGPDIVLDEAARRTVALTQKFAPPAVGDGGGGDERGGKRLPRRKDA